MQEKLENDKTKNIKSVQSGHYTASPLLPPFFRYGWGGNLTFALKQAINWPKAHVRW